MFDLIRRIDRYSLVLLATVLVATLLPCRGAVADGFHVATKLAVALLFFLHGAKLSRAAIVQGVTAWRLHLLVFAITFILFPVLGLGFSWVGALMLAPGLAAGLLFVTLLPSTVQSSIAFTSIARGNVPAAVCSASLSNLIGIALTPLLVALLMGGDRIDQRGRIDRPATAAALRRGPPVPPAHRRFREPAQGAGFDDRSRIDPARRLYRL
jgi:solute carrier family 10 (sodium/bile acid cotransporter), member 7